MDKDVKAKWLTALRSGSYTKGRFRLRRTNNAMCCLGVLCDIVAPNGWIKLASGEWHHTFGEGLTDREGHLQLSKQFAESVGIDVGDRVRLATTNDKTDTFEAVISLIEDM